MLQVSEKRENINRTHWHAHAGESAAGFLCVSLFTEYLGSFELHVVVCSLLNGFLELSATQLIPTYIPVSCSTTSPMNRHAYQRSIQSCNVKKIRLAPLLTIVSEATLRWLWRHLRNTQLRPTSNSIQQSGNLWQSIVSLHSGPHIQLSCTPIEEATQRTPPSAVQTLTSQTALGHPHLKSV